MSEPEKYTLPRVLEIVRGHAAALLGAGAALEATEGKDPEMLAMVGERAWRAKEELWKFESEFVLDEAAREAWRERDENDEASALWHTLYALPLLVMSAKAVAADPHVTASPGNADGFFWLHYEAERIAGVLMAWVEEHEADAEPATPAEAPADTNPPPEESPANGATPKPISEDWARVEAIQTFRPLGQLGRALMDRKFEQAGIVECPRLDDVGVPEDIAFTAAMHLKRWAEMEPPDKLGGAWLTLKATLAMIHVLADRLAIASHSSRNPKWDFSEDGTIPEQEVLDALDVLMRNATERYGAGGEWAS